MRKLRAHLTFANVVSVIALFVALGGAGAYAAATITGADVVDESLTGADVKGKTGNSTTAAVNGTLTGADIAGQAANPAVGQPFVQGSLTTSDIKDSTLGTADLGNGAVTNGKLGIDAVATNNVLNSSLTGSDVSDDTVTGQDIDEATLSLTAEAPHEVGAPGEPAFQNGWSWGNSGGSWVCPNTNNCENESPGFYKDRLGMVHLKGTAQRDSASGSSDVLFVLPLGYRPARNVVFSVPSTRGDRCPEFIIVHGDWAYGDGEVRLLSCGSLPQDLDYGLDPIQFVPR
jgi:hypothetical protein